MREISRRLLNDSVVISPRQADLPSVYYMLAVLLESSRFEQLSLPIFSRLICDEATAYWVSALSPPVPNSRAPTRAGNFSRLSFLALSLCRSIPCTAVNNSLPLSIASVCRRPYYRLGHIARRGAIKPAIDVDRKHKSTTTHRRRTTAHTGFVHLFTSSTCRGNS